MSAVLSAPLRQIRYRVEQTIGQGPSATVFRAFDPVGQRLVALKSFRRGIAQGAHGARLVEQARAVARLAHHGIVAVHDVEVSSASTVVVMEFVEGRSLDGWIAQVRPQPEAIVDAMEQLLDALAHAHHAGLRHGNLKPSNVLVTSSGFVKLVDFGSARQDEATLAAAASRGLVAPELARGRAVDHGVDIFAAGVLLGRMLASREPGAAPADAALSPALADASVRSPLFQAIVARATASEPGDRFRDAESFKDALRQALDRPRLAHGGHDVELGSTLRGGGPAASAAVRALPPASPAEPFGEAASAPVESLRIAIQDDVLGMPAADPWPTTQPQALRESAVDCAAAAGDDVTGSLDPADPRRRASVVSAAHAATAVLAAAAQGPAEPAAGHAPLILSEPAFVPPSESVFGSPLSMFGQAEPGEGIPAEALRRTLKVLTPHFGARAGIVLKQVAGLAHTVDELHDLLVQAAGETIDRRRLRKQLKAVARLPL